MALGCRGLANVNGTHPNCRLHGSVHFGRSETKFISEVPWFLCVDPRCDVNLVKVCMRKGTFETSLGFLPVKSTILCVVDPQPKSPAFFALVLCVLCVCRVLLIAFCCNFKEKDTQLYEFTWFFRFEMSNLGLGNATQITFDIFLQKLEKFGKNRFCSHFLDVRKIFSIRGSGWHYRQVPQTFLLMRDHRICFTKML